MKRYKEFIYSNGVIPEIKVPITVVDARGNLRELEAKLSTADRHCLIPSAVAHSLGLTMRGSYRFSNARKYVFVDIRLPFLEWQGGRVRMFERAGGRHIRLGLEVLNAFRLVADAPKGTFSLEHSGI